MPKKLDPNMCKQCKRKVGKGDSICCSCCSVWYHLKCSGLSKTEFENLTKNKNLYWSCPDCTVYRCAKKAKIIGKKQKCIFCDYCNKQVHKMCSLLKTNVFETLSNSNEPWFCWDCLKNNISCILLMPKVKKWHWNGVHEIYDRELVLNFKSYLPNILIIFNWLVLIKVWQTRSLSQLIIPLLWRKTS